VEVIFCTVALVVVWVWFQSTPPTPPSHSSKMKLNVSTQTNCLRSLWIKLIFGVCRM
jgi:hypothetical protein